MEPLGAAGALALPAPPPVVGTGKPEDYVPPRIGPQYQAVHLPEPLPVPPPPPSSTPRVPVVLARAQPEPAVTELFSEVRLRVRASRPWLGRAGWGAAGRAGRATATAARQFA